MNQATLDVILAAAMAAVLGSVGYAIRRQITAGDKTRAALEKLTRDSTTALERLGREFAAELGKIAVTLAELNTGASAGARAAITDLRAELRAGLRDAERDLERLRSEHDQLAERHNIANATTVQLVERVNMTREDMRDLRDTALGNRRRAGDAVPTS